MPPEFRSLQIAQLAALLVILALCLVWLLLELCRAYTRFSKASGLRQRALAVDALPVWKRYLVYLFASALLFTVWAIALRNQALDFF